MATIEGVYLTDDRDNLIFEYPTSASSPSLKTVLSTVRGSSTTSPHASHNEAVVEVSKTHTVYRQKQGRIVAYAFVRQYHDEESLRLKTIGDSDDDGDDSAPDNDYDQFQDDDGVDASAIASNEEKKSKGKKRTTMVPVNPAFVFVFLHSVITTLLDYFGKPLNPLKIEANYDVMCNLMQELIQGGKPYITDLNALRDLVPFNNSLTSNIIATTNQFAKNYVSGGAKLSSLGSSSGISSSDMAQERAPWRRPNVKYTNNEVFVDLIETINVVLSPYHVSHKTTKGAKSSITTNKLLTTIAFIEGTIDFTSHLSGIPDVLLTLNLAGNNIPHPSFHRAVRVDKWLNRQGVLSFIPADGKSRLAQYTIELDRLSSSHRSQKPIGVITPDYRRGLGVKGNEFEISVNISMHTGVSKIEHLKVEIKTEAHQSVKILRLSHGDFQSGSQGKFEWVFEPSQKLGVTAVLRGIIEDASDADELVDDGDEKVEGGNDGAVHEPKEIALKYELKGALPSGIKVDSLKIVRGWGDVQPYKGVKYICRTGDYVIR